jgi:hypothetical protein
LAPLLGGAGGGLAPLLGGAGGGLAPLLGGAGGGLSISLFLKNGISILNLEESQHFLSLLFTLIILCYIINIFPFIHFL